MNEPVQLSMEVAGVDAMNKAKVCDAIAKHLGGVASECIIEMSRRQLEYSEAKIGQTPRLIVHIRGVRQDEVHSKVSHPNFTSNLDGLPPGATITSVTVVPKTTT